MSIAPILRDIPLAFETERLIIRPARPGEGAILNTAIHESLNQLRPWLPWVHPMPSAEESEIHVRRKYAQYLTREDFTLRLWSKKTGDLIGSSGLHPKDWSVPTFEIGYWCRSQYSGQGYITEATQGIARFGFENVRAERIEIRCEKSNARSRRVAEHAGFNLDATLKNGARTVDGTLCDILLFSLTREEFAGLAPSWPPIKVL